METARLIPLSRESQGFVEGRVLIAVEDAPVLRMRRAPASGFVPLLDAAALDGCPDQGQRIAVEIRHFNEDVVTVALVPHDDIVNLRVPAFREHE